MEVSVAFGSFNLHTNPSDPAMLSKGSNPGGGLSRPLSFGEQQALAMQEKNRASAAGSHAQVEARQAAPAVDTAAKAPRFFSSAWSSPVVTRVNGNAAGPTRRVERRD
jgi:hypothetical protein